MIQRLNNRLAITITRGVSTMACAYIFALLALVSFPAALTSADPVVLVSWVSQTFLQLVLLSIIMVGQKVLADSHADLHDKVDQLAGPADDHRP